MIGELYNISGLIIYSDPADDGFRRGTVYPEGTYRSPTSVQRGSAQYISLFSGDPLTPGVAAVRGLDPSAKKYTKENSPTLPKIPIQPMSYGDAKHLLKSLKGLQVKDVPALNETGFQGGLEFDYRIGSVGENSADAVMVRMHLEMNNTLSPIKNVVATIPVCFCFFVCLFLFFLFFFFT